MEGFLDHMGKAYEVVLLLLKEIIPQLGIYHYRIRCVCGQDSVTDG